MLGQKKPDTAFLVSLGAIQDWTRARFKLAEGAAVLVCQVACRLPGCPPLETVVAFWTEDEARHQFKLYKPVAEVVYDDIGWLMGGAVSHEGAGWDCC